MAQQIDLIPTKPRKPKEVVKQADPRESTYDRQARLYRAARKDPFLRLALQLEICLWTMHASSPGTWDLRMWAHYHWFDLPGTPTPGLGAMHALRHKMGCGWERQAADPDYLRRSAFAGFRRLERGAALARVIVERMLALRPGCLSVRT